MKNKKRVLNIVFKTYTVLATITLFILCMIISDNICDDEHNRRQIYLNGDKTNSNESGIQLNKDDIDSLQEEINRLIDRLDESEVD